MGVLLAIFIVAEKTHHHGLEELEHYLTHYL